MPATVSLCIASHERPVEVAAAVRSAAGQGFDEIVVLDNASEPPLSAVAGERVVRSDENLGVSGGRNRLADTATGEVLVYLDDDAVLRPGVAGVVRRAFEADPGLGAMAFRIERDDGRLVPGEQPFRRGGGDRDAAAPCAYFIGAGFAVRRRAYWEVGGSDERLFWGSDDIELAFRLLHAGWGIRYDPAATIEHRPSPRGRLAGPVRSGHHLRNRLLVARTYLPAPVVLVHALAWIGLTATEAWRAGGLRPWARELRRAVREPVRRRPIPLGRLVEIHRLGGRVLY